MIALELIPQENRETVFRRRLDVLLENPECRSIYFKIAESMYVLGISSYRYKSMVIRLNDSKSPSVIVLFN